MQFLISDINKMPENTIKKLLARPLKSIIKDIEDGKFKLEEVMKISLFELKEAADYNRDVWKRCTFRSYETRFYLLIDFFERNGKDIREYLNTLESFLEEKNKSKVQVPENVKFFRKRAGIEFSDEEIRYALSHRHTIYPKNHTEINRELNRLENLRCMIINLYSQFHGNLNTLRIKEVWDEFLEQREKLRRSEKYVCSEEKEKSHIHILNFYNGEIEHIIKGSKYLQKFNEKRTPSLCFPSLDCAFLES